LISLQSDHAENITIYNIYFFYFSTIVFQDRYNIIILTIDVAVIFEDYDIINRECRSSTLLNKRIVFIVKIIIATNGSEGFYSVSTAYWHRELWKIVLKNAFIFTKRFWRKHQILQLYITKFPRNSNFISSILLFSHYLFNTQ